MELELRQVFPHDKMVCGIGEIKKPVASNQYIRTSNFPLGLFLLAQRRVLRVDSAEQNVPAG